MSDEISRNGFRRAERERRKRFSPRASCAIQCAAAFKRDTAWSVTLLLCFDARTGIWDGSSSARVSEGSNGTVGDPNACQRISPGVEESVEFTGEISERAGL